MKTLKALVNIEAMITLKRLFQQKRTESSALSTGFRPLFPPSLLSSTFLNSLCDIPH